ncbi:putative tetratricopeptide-like helical domain superfamily [Helianthus anomalus]
MLGLNPMGSQQVHDLVVKEGFEHDLYVSTYLVDVYAKLGKMDCAQKLVDEMLKRSQVSWTLIHKLPAIHPTQSLHNTQNIT